MSIQYLGSLKRYKESQNPQKLDSGSKSVGAANVGVKTEIATYQGFDKKQGHLYKVGTEIIAASGTLTNGGISSQKVVVAGGQILGMPVGIK